MEDLLTSLFPHLKKEGVKDYDDLTPDEQSTYREILQIQEKAQITLEDYKRHIHTMRQSVEFELAKLPNDDPRNTGYKARLLNYLFLEALFERPDRARMMLEQYSKKKTI